MTTPAFPGALAEDVLLGPFWIALAEQRLVLPRCSDCRDWQWYPHAAGPHCPGAHLEWLDVDPVGVVHTMTTIHRQFVPGDETPLPRVVALVVLDDAPGIRLVAELDPHPELGIGARVRGRFTAAGGQPSIRFVFTAPRRQDMQT